MNSETNKGGASGFEEEVEADGCGAIVAVRDGVSQDRLGERVLIHPVQQKDPSENGKEEFNPNLEEIEESLSRLSAKL